MRLYRLAVLAIGVKEKKENRERDMKCIEDSSSSSSSSSQTKSSVGGNLARTLEPPSLAEAWKLRTACCNNLAACHFQVIFHFCLKFVLSFIFLPSVGQSRQCRSIEHRSPPGRFKSGKYRLYLQPSHGTLLWTRFSGEGALPSGCFLSWIERVWLCWAGPRRRAQGWAFKQVSAIQHHPDLTRKYSLASQNLGIGVLLKT